MKRPAEKPVGEAPESGALRWVSDGEPGLRRMRRGSGFSYVDAHGRPVRDAAVLARIRKLAIPPAYREVWICADAEGHLQATGIDARGRKQYRYHPSWTAHRQATKFERLREFGMVLPRIRRRVAQQLARRGAADRDTVLAALVRLLDTTFLRVGNAEYRQANGSFGLSTLRKRHAVARGAEISLAFRGKGGLPQRAQLHDRRVARVLRRCQDLPGQHLFSYADADGRVHDLGSSDINDWLAQAGAAHVTAKDFRTWHGTVQALALILRRSGADGDPLTVPAVAAEVSRRLGNTPAVCRKAYIHPDVLQLIGGDGPTPAELLAAARASTGRQRGLNIAERALLRLLDAGAITKRRRR